MNDPWNYPEQQRQEKERECGKHWGFRKTAQYRGHGQYIIHVLIMERCMSCGCPRTRRNQSSFLKENENHRCANGERHALDDKISADSTAGYHRIEPAQVQNKEDLTSSRRHESLNRHELISEFPAMCP